MQFDCFLHQLQRFAPCLCGCNAPWKVGHVRAVSRARWGDENGVFIHRSPACLSIELFVFGSNSSEGCPATVTLPGFYWMNELPVSTSRIFIRTQ